MLEKLLADLKVTEGEELLVMSNGAGATTLMELYLVFRRVAQVLQARKIKLVRSAIGEFITTQEQAGFQMMIMRTVAGKPAHSITTSKPCPLVISGACTPVSE